MTQDPNVRRLLDSLNFEFVLKAKGHRLEDGRTAAEIEAAQKAQADKENAPHGPQ